MILLSFLRCVYNASFEVQEVKNSIMGKTINSRSKGKRGEREVINKILQPIVIKEYCKRGLKAPLIARNLQQSDKGGYDIIGLSWLAIEVKFVEKENIPSWWAQTLNQCGKGQIPILLYRKSRAKWRAVTRGFLPSFDGNGKTKVFAMPVDVAIEPFKRWLSYEIGRRLDHEKVVRQEKKELVAQFEAKHEV